MIETLEEYRESIYQNMINNGLLVEGKNGIEQFKGSAWDEYLRKGQDYKCPCCNKNLYLDFKDKHLVLKEVINYIVDLNDKYNKPTNELI